MKLGLEKYGIKAITSATKDPRKYCLYRWFGFGRNTANTNAHYSNLSSLLVECVRRLFLILKTILRNTTYIISVLLNTLNVMQADGTGFSRLDLESMIRRIRAVLASNIMGDGEVWLI